MNKKILYIFFAVFLITALSFAQDTYDITLKSGDNLVALPLIPQDKNIANILFPIITQVKDVWEFNPADPSDPWKHYQPGMEAYSDLKQMDPGKGYWVNVKSNVTLQVSGSPIAQNYSFNLKSGWNLLGWPYQYPQEITAALSTLNFGTDYSQVSRFNSSTKAQENFINQSAIDNFSNLEPAKAYYIYMLQDKVVEIAAADTTLPQIISIAPIGGSTFLAGAAINIQINATGQNIGTFQYKFSIGGAIKQNWSAANSYLWQTSDSDTGATSITCEVRDPKGNKASKIISYSIINPTIEEVLKKVADNYAQIYDFKADMALSATLNGQPFGETEYCRYLFLAPNKEKTETFSDSTRAVKTDIVIMNGSTMHLINPLKNIKQTVDLLGEAGISSAQFNQLDLYYNQPNFLNSHIIVKNYSDTDFNNMIICLDALPKETNNLYTKLKLYIDYNKGLLTKLYLYKQNEKGEVELIQTLEAEESIQLPNGAWLPVKMKKSPVLKAGVLIETAVYSGVQVNIGLSDLDLDPDKQ